MKINGLDLELDRQAVRNALWPQSFENTPSLEYLTEYIATLFRTEIKLDNGRRGELRLPDISFARKNRQAAWMDVSLNVTPF
jgi:hypothetical protein